MLNVVFCSAEVAPFAKVGGLGDVVGSLPKALAEQGVQASVMMPRYGMIEPEAFGFDKIKTRFNVWFEGKEELVSIWKGTLPGSDTVTVYLLEHEFWFADNPAVYPIGQTDYEVGRFRFFSQAVLEGLEALDIQPDVIHVHDWHTAMIPALLAQEKNLYFSDTRTVLTIHNLAYQGWHDNRNYLVEGIWSADWITTVSPTYAQEIQTAEYGCGLDSLLRDSAQRLQGIVNGIDMERFNPQTDSAIVQHYDVSSVEAGKARCKIDLQQAIGLPVESEVSLFGFVSRLVDQKGLDILLPVLMDTFETTSALAESQWVILGSGEQYYESALRILAKRFPQVAVQIGFDTGLAQRIYAGSDFFLMPSRFEPCGLGQLIAMRYGSIPVVRATGGLADTVIDVTKNPEKGTGVCFDTYDSSALKQALQTAIGYYKDRAAWRKFRQNAMVADFSWETSAKAYCAIYNNLTSRIITVKN